MINRLLLLAGLCNILVSTSVSSQVLDPYRRINDPLAIADLGGPDSMPLIHAFNSGPANATDPYDGYTVLAEDSGAGIIRHFWTTYGNNDTATANAFMRLWVDDSLVIDAKAGDLFTKVRGMMRPPFDSVSGGARTMDVQIPFKRNFRWTATGQFLFRDAVWQRVDTTKFHLPAMGSAVLDSLQIRAESILRNGIEGTGAQHTFGRSLEPSDTLTIANIAGPGYLQQIQVRLPLPDTALLHNQWLEIYWDNSPRPSVEIPLSDFFGVAMGIYNIKSFYIRVDSANSNFNCTFPMPFLVNARVQLINKDSRAAFIEGTLTSQAIPWDRHFGYFSTEYHVTNEIALHQVHPILHRRGSGRYVGAILNYPHCNYFQPDFLEGDGYLVLDSTPYGYKTLSSHYTGTEDYTCGGWYYLNQSYTTPFYGCPNWWHTVYRFHISEPYNYSKSIDFDLGHGFSDDFTVTMRSATFHYVDWIPFYPSSDTVIAGNVWKITGSGYGANSDIVAKLDTAVFYRGKADANGSIAIGMTVPQTWTSGTKALSINGVVKPDPIVVLRTPKLLYVQDSAGRTFSEGDSIQIRGYGFLAGERLRLFAGDTAFSSLVRADSDGTVREKMFLPWVPQGLYHLSSLRTSGDKIVSDSTLFVTRTLSYEFEIMPMTEGHLVGGEGDVAYLGYPYKHWSQGSMRFCNGNWHPKSRFAFQFSAPYADSFDVTVFSTTGNRYCSYRTFIDSVDLGAHDWYRPYIFPLILRDSQIMRNVFLTKGTHTILFVTDSWHDSTYEYSIGPDDMHLAPLSAFTKAAAPIATQLHASISVYPDPLSRGELHLSGLTDSATTITLLDGLGRQVFVERIALPFPDETLTIPLLPNGTYWLHVTSAKTTETLPLTIIR